MISLTETQRKAVACAVTALSAAIVVAFVAFVAWWLLKVLAFTSAALVPVFLGFVLALFFKPYFRWWKGVVKNPTLAVTIMLATVLVPAGLLLWYAGSVLVDQISNLVAQGPTLAKIMLRLESDYGCRFEFCHPARSARRICELLGVEWDE